MNWWKGLPTEFQFGILALVLGVICWLAQWVHPTLEKSIGSMLTFISSVCLGVLAHGATTRLSKNPEAMADLKGG